MRDNELIMGKINKNISIDLNTQEDCMNSAVLFYLKYILDNNDQNKSMSYTCIDKSLEYGINKLVQDGTGYTIGELTTNDPIFISIKENIVDNSINENGIGIIKNGSQIAEAVSDYILKVNLLTKSTYTKSLYFLLLAYKISSKDSKRQGELSVKIKNISEKLLDFISYKDENKICVYAICKNEAKFVDKWVESMREADYIAVLDTGSTDDTVEKLKKYSFVHVETKVINPWRFDTARNESMKLIPEDMNILVCTDLDEVFEPGWSYKLREKWDDNKHIRCYYKYSWSHLPNGADGRIFWYDKIHSRKWTWKYPVHEMLVETSDNPVEYTMDHVLNLFDYIHLHHYPDQTKSRGSYLPLLEIRAKEDPEDYYGLIYLAHEYNYRGFFDRSIGILDRILTSYSDKIDSLEQASCYLFKGDGYMALNKYREAQLSYLEAIKIEPTYREPYINLGKAFFETQEYDLSIKYIKMSLEKTYRHYTWLERDISWTYEPYDNLSLACYYGGYKKESLLYAYKAYRYEPENERLKNNIEIILDNMSDIDFI